VGLCLCGFICLCALCLSAIAVPGQTVGSPPVQTVRIDAIVEDARGRFIDDLKVSDFELREEGAAALESVQLRRADGPRVAAIYLDEYHIGRESVTDSLRQGLTRFVDSLAPGDELVVMKPLDSLLAIRLTTDREAALHAIAGFEGRKGELEPRNTYEQNFIAGTPARIEAARTQVAVSALNALANQLGTAGVGRKGLIVVSEGLVRSERRRGQEFMPSLDTVARSANRANVSIYIVDPRSDSVPDDPPRQTMRSLAADTGGDYLVALETGLRRIAAELGGYYLLTYQAPHAEDGQFHAVQLTMKRPGVRARARKGFWAPSPDDAFRAALIARINEPRKPVVPEPMRHLSPLIRPWVGLARGQDGKTRVTIVWEPAAAVPGDRNRRSPSRVVLTALADDGTALFQGPLLPTGPGAVEDGGSLPTRAVFDAVPGRLRLRMSVQGVAAEVLDSDVRDLAVSNFDHRVAIGTPAVMRARNAREVRLLDGDGAVPVASRDFSRAEHLLIRFPAYAPGSPPALSAKLLNRLGSPMRELTIVPAAAPDGENQIELSLAGLASGDYMIELKATSPAGEARDRIAFRVTS
jgi:VWFA-related protein